MTRILSDLLYQQVVEALTEAQKHHTATSFQLVVERYGSREAAAEAGRRVWYELVPTALTALRSLPVAGGEPTAYVTAIEEGKVLMLPRPSLNTQGLVPLLAAPKETHPGCHCAKCNPGKVQMFLCPQCGCKRCPQASNHEAPCSGKTGPEVPGGHTCTGCEEVEAMWAERERSALGEKGEKHA
jgi:hypothetical protein